MLLLLFPGVAVSVDSKGKNSAERSYALELHVRGVIHVQVERLPPVIGTLLTSVVSVTVTWLATVGIHVH
jgi:hypothetical protein